MRRWLVAVIMGFAACGGRAESASLSASLPVSVTVLDQCLVHSTSRSASCTGGAVYALGVAQERVPAASRDRLTLADEHAQASSDGSLVTTSKSVAGGVAGRQGAASEAVRTVAATVEPVESIRVTYSF